MRDQYKDLFLFPTPFTSELKEEYGSKWRFNAKVVEATLAMYKHPKHNKRWHKLCNELMTQNDANDMLKSAYRLFEEYKAHPQRYGGELENMIDQMLVSMWRVFISLHNKARKNITGNYKAMAVMQMRDYAKRVWLDELVKCEYEEYSPASSERCGLGTHEGSKNFEYLVQLGENEISSLL
jgi:hypothetical protein